MPDDQSQDQTNHQQMEWSKMEAETAASALARIYQTSKKSTNAETSAVHWVMHSQGGIGKSVKASWLAQVLIDHGRNVECIDADPMNKSLTRFECLNARSVSLLNDDDELDMATMDEFIEDIVDEPSDFVIDCGSSGFIPLASYLMRDDILSYLTERGKTVYIHTVVVGGDRQDHTLARAKDIISQMPSSVRIVVWLNPHFGPIRFEQQIKTYFVDNGGKVIRLPNTHPKRDGAVIEKMLVEGITFSELLEGDTAPLAKRRVAPFWADVSASVKRAVFDEA